jgi:uncharacterized protein YqhQ
MVRSAGGAVIVVRAPDGELRTRIERSTPGPLTRALRRIPFLRGIVALIETVGVGSRALAWSTHVASSGNDASERGRLDTAALVSGLAMASLVFFVGPAAATFWLDRWLAGLAVTALEGGLRLVLLLVYMWNISRSPQLRRMFQYHGAEHMAIQAHEEQLPLTAPTVRRLPKEHARCGTAFLLTVVVVSVVVFLPFDGGPSWWRLGSRLLLVPVVAGVAYEAIRLGAAHPRLPVVRWLFDANLALQRLTTREPDDEQLRVAIAAVERALDVERGGGAPA